MAARILQARNPAAKMTITDSRDGSVVPIDPKEASLLAAILTLVLDLARRPAISRRAFHSGDPPHQQAKDDERHCYQNRFYE
jgi:hypothetical protein